MAHSITDLVGLVSTVVAVSNSVATRDYQWQTSGSPRWIARTNNDAESGSQAGSNFEFMSRNDDGSFRAYIYKVARTTGVVDFTSVPTVNGVPLGTSSPVYGTPALTFSTTNAEGTGNAIRTNATVALFDATTPANLAAAAATGSAGVAARRDHVHSTTGLGVLATANTWTAINDYSGTTGLGAAAANFTIAGTNSTPVKAKFYWGDGTGWQLVFATRSASVDTTRHTFFDNGNYTATGTIAGNTVTSGGNTVLTTASGAAPALTLGTSNAAGTANTFVRTDATILTFDATVPVALGTAAAGSAAVAARRDHVHPTTGLVLTSTATAKGDIYVATASNTITRLGVGADGTVLTAASGQATGLQWAAATGGHVIENNGTPLTQRANLNFGAGITASDDAGGAETDVILDLTANNAWTGTGTTSFAGDLTVADHVAFGRTLFTSARMAVGGTIPASTSAFGGHFDVTFSNQANGNIRGLYIKMTTAAATYTTDTAYGILVDTLVKGAGNTITDLYGMRISSQTGSGTTVYGLRIDTQGGGALWLGAETNATDISGGIIFGNSKDTSIYRMAAGTLRLGNNAAFGSMTTFGGGTGGVLAISNATIPSTNPTGGVLLYSDAGLLKWRSPAGTVYDLSTVGSTSFGTPALTFSTTNSAGVASTAMRTDATIAIFDGTVPAALGTAATGSAAFAARRDHVHPTTGLAVLTAANVFTNVNEIERNGIATTSTDGLLLENSTVSTVGVPAQYSPRIRFRGHAWDTDGSVNNTEDTIIEIRSVSGTVPYNQFVISQSYAGGAYVDIITATTGAILTPGAYVTQGSGGGFNFYERDDLTATGQWVLYGSGDLARLWRGVDKLTFGKDTNQSAITVLAATGHTANLIDLQVNAVTKAAFTADGVLNLNATTANSDAPVVAGSNIGDKISLYKVSEGGGFGFGVQAFRMVAHVASNSGFSIRASTATGGPDSAGTDVHSFGASGYWSLGGPAQVGSGTGVIGFIADATTAPTTNPTGGILLYSESGVLKWRSPGGTVYNLSATGSQTPWTSNIDADGWALNDLGEINFRTTGSQIINNLNSITWGDGGDIDLTWAAASHLKLWDAFTILGNVGLQSDKVDDVALNITDVDGSGATRDGIKVVYGSTTTNTTYARGISSRVNTPNLSHTNPQVSAYYADTPTIGAAGIITDLYGLYVAPQTNATGRGFGARLDTGTTAALWLGGDAAGTTVTGGITFGSGRDVSIFRSAANALTLGATSGVTLTGALTTTGLTVSAGNFRVDSSGRAATHGTTIDTDTLIYGNAAHPGGGTTVYGVRMDYLSPNTATTASWVYYSRLRTGAAYTLTQGINYLAASPSRWASSAITSTFGFYAANQGDAGVTNSYGFYAFPQTGATTLNVGARFDTSTTAALWLGGDTTSTTVAGGITFGSGRDVNIFRSAANTINITATGTAVLQVGGNTVLTTATGAQLTTTNAFTNTNTFSKKTAGGTGSGSIIAGDDIAAAVGTGLTTVTAGNTSGVAGFVAGQDGTHNLIMSWAYNATVGNAYAYIETWAGGNQLRIQNNAGSLLLGGASATIGFFGATPVAKQGSTTDLRTALINLGLYTTGGASPLDLNGGALTAGSAVVTGGQFRVDSAGRVSVNASISTDRLIGMAGVHPGTQATLYGFVSFVNLPTTATTAYIGTWSGYQAGSAATFAEVNSFNANGASVFGVAGGVTVTKAVGLKVENHGASGSGTIVNAYGLQVLAQSGASTLNIAASLEGGTQANLWLNSNTASAAGGIAFGTARDVTLYRNAADLSTNAILTDVNRSRGQSGGQAVGSTGTALQSYGHNATLTVNGTNTAGPLASGRFVKYASGAVSGNIGGLTPAAFTDWVQRRWNPDLYMRISVDDTAITTNRIWCGWVSAAMTGKDAPTTEHVAAFRYATTVDGTAFWRCVTHDGGATPTVTTTTTAIAVGGTYNLRIAMSGSSVYFYIDGALVATHTTALPGTSTGLGLNMTTTTQAASARNIRVGMYKFFAD